jgi:hypothetical protein
MKALVLFDVLYLMKHKMNPAFFGLERAGLGDLNQ